MFVQIRKWTVTEGNADKVIERFKKKPEKGPSLMEQREGYIGRELLLKNVRSVASEFLPWCFRNERYKCQSTRFK